ncbi:hypothetical protein HDV62DRAFT_341298 [Trichoderma sp. SZMC 28011]
MSRQDSAEPYQKQAIKSTNKTSLRLRHAAQLPLSCFISLQALTLGPGSDSVRLQQPASANPWSILRLYYHTSASVGLFYFAFFFLFPFPIYFAFASKLWCLMLVIMVSLTFFHISPVLT